MRIIGGEHKGRRINPPTNLPVRPTTDMAKEALFNILNNLIDFEDLQVLDLFAGTGSISYEFASRNAARVIAVDLNFKCVEFIRKTVRELKMNSLSVVRADVMKFLNHPFDTFDLIFSDAPYDLKEMDKIPEVIISKGWLKKNARLIVEHSKEIDFSGHPYFEQQRKYGKVCFSFFRPD